MTNTVTNTFTLPGVKVVGKINLAKKDFKPFSGGATIGEMLKAQGVSLK